LLDRISSDGDATHAAEPAVAAPTPAKTPADRPDAGVSPSTIRIEQNKLDRLMRVVGELLVGRGAFPLLVQKLNDGADGAGLMKDLKEAGSNISRIADELQNSVMSIRMLPVKTVFQRFPPVRDLANLGRSPAHVEEGIELDKIILEQMGSAVHGRNAVDHGLETPAERRARKRPGSRPCATRSVAIEVTDDGGVWTPGFNGRPSSGDC
jgi:two-component system chemotaxis sensor kinase CheA